MKKMFVLVLLFFCVGFAQDMIIYKSGRILKAHVKHVGDDKITYAKKGYPNGLTYAIDKKKVEKILYENGDVDDLFKKEEVKPQHQVEAAPVKPAVKTVEFDYILWDRTNFFGSYKPHDMNGNQLTFEKTLELLSTNDELLTKYRDGRSRYSTGLAVGTTVALIPIGVGMVRALQTGDMMSLYWGGSIALTIATTVDIFTGLGIAHQYEAIYEHNKKLCPDTVTIKNSMELFALGRRQYSVGRVVGFTSSLPLWIGTAISHNKSDDYFAARIGFLTSVAVVFTGSMISTAGIKKMIRGNNVLSHPDKFYRKVSFGLGLQPNGASLVMKF